MGHPDDISDKSGAAEVSRIIQSQHPSLGYELQAAIRALRKLQKITGGNAEPRPPVPEDTLSTAIKSTHGDMQATSDPTITDGTLIDGRVNQGEAGGATLVDATFGDRKVSDGSSDDATLLSDPSGDAALADDEGALFAPGDGFGRYQITRQLGQGAMGAVFLAYDGQLDRYVALKFPFLNSADGIARFYREARAAAKLRSRNICAVHDVNQINGIHFISMEYIDGQPLSKLYKAGLITSIVEILEFVKKIALALQHAHDANIIHRDMKLDNVMIDQEREPIIMDFGLARSVGDDEAGITRFGALLGTPAYMSPEQTQGDQNKLGPATDIYSLGVMLYHMITGSLPFSGSVTSVIAQVSRDDPEKPSCRNPTITPGSAVETICLKMMAKAVEDRYACMRDAAKAIDECQCLLQQPSSRSKGIGGLLKRLVSRAG